MGKKEYILENKAYLAQKAEEEGVQRLDGGVLYKVVKSGEEDGRHPGPNDVVLVYYVGRTIDGKAFDACVTGAPLAMRLRELIGGWVIALQKMSVGDKWEVYIPAELGYGKFSQPGIPGNSTLIFEIELLGIA